MPRALLIRLDPRRPQDLPIHRKHIPRRPSYIMLLCRWTNHHLFVRIPIHPPDLSLPFVRLCFVCVQESIRVDGALRQVLQHASGEQCQPSSAFPLRISAWRRNHSHQLLSILGHRPSSRNASERNNPVSFPSVKSSCPFSVS